MAAILLGFGVGPFAETHRLWIDLSHTPNGNRRYALRVSTKGQPFGYEIENPNKKTPLSSRRNCFDRWLGINDEDDEATRFRALWAKWGCIPRHGKYRYPTHSSLHQENEDTMRINLQPYVFRLVQGKDLFQGNDRTFPLALLLRHTAKTEAPELLREVERRETLYFVLPPEASDFTTRLGQIEKWGETAPKFAKVIRSKLVVKRLAKEIEPDCYGEFFKRIGQGGTVLTDDELSYSLIKLRFPRAREALEKIVRSKEVGYLASPTQIALAALRLKRMQTFKDEEVFNTWERIARPTPDFVESLPIFKSLSSGPVARSTKDERKAWILVDLAVQYENILTPSEGDRPVSCSA